MTAPNLFILVKRLRHSLIQPDLVKVREVHPHDLASLRRSLARLYKQNRHLKTQLSDLGIKRIAEGNNQFDADSYRKALELNVKQEVFEKIRNLFAVIALIGGFGLFVQFRGIVENSVANELKENPQIVEIREELTEQLERSQRDMLLTLMQAAVGTADHGILDPLAVERIKNNKEEIDGYIQQMQNLIQESEGQARELAIRYAAQTQDSDLQEILLTELRESTDLEVRLSVLEALMQYPEEDLIEPLEIVEQEGEKSQGEFWQGAIHYLSKLRIKSNAPILRDVMNHALQSENPQIVRSALVFFTLNPQIWNGDIVEQIPSQILSDKQFSQLQALIQISELPDLPPERQTESKRILASLANSEASSNEENSEDAARWQEQLQEMQRYFAQKSLSVGNTKLLVELREIGQQYYSYSDWREEILEFFPDFEQRNAVLIESAHTEEDQHKLQDRLISTIDTTEPDEAEVFVWSPPDEVYKPLSLKEPRQFQEALRSMLRQGSMDLFSSNYLPNSNDESTALHKSPDLWSEVQGFFPDATAEQKQNQEALQNWLTDNSGLLWWDLSTGKYRLSTAENSVAQLNQGNLQPFLSWMSSTYYEEQVWRDQVLPLFPDAPETLFSAAPPTGDYGEQDNLWRWVEEKQVSLQWQPDRKQYELSDR
ncbi:HEAT repeat domain-containing protein [Leptolyngbya sp. FACHB-671]|uniref:HEAT repeat domain-containing protein n=1 Tax=Leptolyngbya sp. FACHB-671 TaxID=2692812 RepID=UPI0016885080|nr:HEAT repeat domain-containing protein [Leptolyngbya sp. FACHB-671]MBD2070662.1 HEAT repeat domain-containing protein [Leptolyngbya sp. FACHB-671]